MSLEPSRVLDVADRVVGSVNDERRHLYGGDDVANVDFERHAHEGDRLRRARRLHLQTAELLAETLVALSAGNDVIGPEPFAPAPGDTLELDAGFELFARRLAPRPVLGGLFLHLGPAEDERPSPIWIRRREEDRHRPAFGDTHQGRCFRAGRVHDGADVVHPLFERAEADAVGQPHAALVEQDQPRERCKSFAEAAVLHHGPEHLEIRDRAGHKDEI